MTAKADPHKDAELLAWVASHVRQAQDEGAYCKVVVHLEGGRITRTERNETFKPPEPGMRPWETGHGV